MTTVTKTQLIDLKEAAKDNEDFRRVLFTTDKSQIVLMSLPEAESIGPEVHEADQLVYIVEGEGTTFLDGKGVLFEKGAMLCVPAGASHVIVNTSDEPLKFFTIYAPPQHAPGVVQRTMADPEAEPIPA